jgi:3-phenylpropionate/trans-cinnamate dioxygenase ferredoxin subunit
MSSVFTAVAAMAEIPRGGNKAFKVDGHDILICAAGDDFYAVKNQCTHQQSALEGGAMRGCYLFCPLHGLRFDLRDGSAKGKLAKGPVATYPVRLRDGMIEVALG